MDNDLYPSRPIVEREPVRWPGDAGPLVNSEAAGDEITEHHPATGAVRQRDVA